LRDERRNEITHRLSTAGGWLVPEPAVDRHTHRLKDPQG